LLHEEGDGPPAGRLRDKTMPVMSRPPDAHKEALGSRLPGIVLHRGDLLAQVTLQEGKGKAIN
jgi:hypothetical protein